MNPFRDALDLRPRPSRQFRFLVIILHAVALVVLAAAAWRFAWLWLRLPPLAVGADWQLGRACAPTCRRALSAPSGGPTEAGAGMCRRPRWSRRIVATVCTPRIAVLHLRPRDRRDTSAVPILLDNVDDEAFRRLRAQLRLHGAAPA